MTTNNSFATMHEALKRALDIVEIAQKFLPVDIGGDARKVEGVISAALAIQPRNCDAGTAEEQMARFNSFCDQRSCDECELSMNGCRFVWAQMPYAKERQGETDGSK